MKANSTTLDGESTEVAERLLGVRDVAKRLGVSTLQVWKLVTAGGLPTPARLGLCVRWKRVELEVRLDRGCCLLDLWERMRESRR